MAKVTRNHSRKTWANPRYTVLALLLLAFAVIGFIIYSSHAATINAAFSLSASTISGNATKITDASASTGQAALFGNPSSPSNQPIPIGDLPGWRQVFTDDFTGNVSIGSFPSAVSAKWWDYPDGWQDTSKNGTYMPSQVVSMHNGMMDMNIHTVGTTHMVAAPVPLLPGRSANNENGVLYGRYAVRFKSDNLPGYKTAWLLWPDSETWPRDGEIDFPEANLYGGATVSAFMHRLNGSSGGDQDAYGTSTVEADGNWHTVVIEWSLGRCSFILDGKVIGTSTARVPNTSMHYVMQTETNLSGAAIPSSTNGHILIDWVAVWRPV